MRPLFISEQRYIRNTLWHWTKTEFKDFDPVVQEYYTPPRSPSGIRFNNDYTLQFVSSNQLKRQCKSYGATILPNTIGVDVFVTVDEQTSQPVMTELLGGEAFSMKYFKEHVQKVEDRLAELSHPVELRRTSYCRIFVIENDICFLAFPNAATPIIRGQRELLFADADSSIACSMEGSDLVYVDGWTRTYVAESERKLEAQWGGGKKTGPIK
jgi:hypothetical protein